MKNLLKKLLTKYREYKFYKNNLHLYGSDWNYKHGFKLDTVSVCKINKNNYKSFLSDREYETGHPWNGVYSSIIDSKLYLPMLFNNYKEYLPIYYYFKDKCGFLNLYGECRERRQEIADFLVLLKDKKRLCLKHTHSSVGQGFYLVSFENGNYYVNNELIERSEFVGFVDSLDEYIITEYIIQHEYSSRICSSSVNSIRFLCAWDYEKKEFFLTRCFHRFGCNGNVVDNVGSGNGLLVFVDTETGILKSNGAINQNNQGDRIAEDIIHPDSGILLTGLQIPNFNEVKQKVLSIANSVSFLRWVGFDVVITKDGFKIIEVNSLSSLVDQGCDGYLNDVRLRRLFKK